jgi:uncharacterized protein (TIGR00251 family)
MKDVDKVNIRDVAGGCVIAVKVVPGASRDKIAGVLGDCVKIATSAPPEKGKANAAVAAILARSLGLDRRDVELASGPTNPRKEFRIAGLSSRALRKLMEDMA